MVNECSIINNWDTHSHQFEWQQLSGEKWNYFPKQIAFNVLVRESRFGINEKCIVEIIQCFLIAAMDFDGTAFILNVGVGNIPFIHANVTVSLTAASWRETD